MRTGAPFISGLLATTALATPVLAQSDAALPPRYVVDGNSVDPATGLLILTDESVSIGSANSGMSFQRSSSGGLFSNHPYVYALYGDRLVKNPIQVVAGGLTLDFNKVGSVYVNQQGSGETLTVSGIIWTLTLRDGTVVTLDQGVFDDQGDIWAYRGRDALAVAKTIVLPNKEKLTLTYKSILTGGFVTSAARLQSVQSVQSSNGHMAKLEYSDNTTYGFNWNFINKVTLINSSVEYCNPAADSCTLTGNWPKLTFVSPGFGPGTHTTTDALNRTTTYTFGTGSPPKLTAIRRPTSATNNTTVTYTATTPSRVSSITTDGRTWNYAWSLSGTQLTATITNPDTSQRVIVSDTTIGLPLTVTDELNRTTSYQYDAVGRVTRVIFPEPGKVDYIYDARGNITQTTRVSKTPETPADIIETASYPASCTNPRTCNQPTSTADARGNITDYTYDTTHGGVLTVTQPAPTIGAVRPQTRYSYVTKQAYYKNSSGSIVASGQNTHLLSAVSACQTLSSCAGAADEVKVTVDYGPQTAGTANNLLPISISRGSGDGSLTATVANTFDTTGNLTYIDGPLTGAADTTRTLYDAARQTIGQIGPDPDGGSALKNRAARLTYNLDGQVTKAESGTTLGQTDTDWTNFVAAEAVEAVYDASGRVSQQKLTSGSTIYALTQMSYDFVGRLDCSAVRMNSATYGSLPASACTLGTQGSFGPDRITKRVYDVASQVTEQRAAVGVAGQEVAEATFTYTTNGRVQTLKDAENNLTTYEYDGFDRLLKTRFPVATKGANSSSTTDYEQLTYDAGSNVTNRRLRDAQNIAFTYDNLNRPTLKNLPGAEPDVTYAYDNLGRLTSAAQTGNSLSFSYDALSRNLTQVGPQGTVTSEWDIAGRRTKLTYPGSGLYLEYDYLVTGETTKIRENGATSEVGVLATYGYDNLGRTTSLTFGNGASQAYDYDPVSRLSLLTNQLTGTTNDLSATFSYSPASQTASTARTGDAYAWTGHFNTNVTGTANGLNQLTSVGVKNLAHDARGNVTAFGSKSFTYSSENLLLTGPGSTTLSYDPSLRLQQIVSGGTTTRLVYDGLDRIAEYDGTNNLQRRYVHGPGDDELLVWYEGSGTSLRSFMSSDDLGSIISLTDSSGTVLNLNKYDEYGNPQTGNLGAFGYTGQTWLPGMGVWYYKARVYGPELGRFLQTDPIDTEGGINLYAYVGNDPINLVDPLGLEDKWRTSQSPAIVPEIVVIGSRLPEPPSFADLIGVSLDVRAGLLRSTLRNFERSINNALKKLGKKAFCAAPSYNFGGDVGGGVRGLGGRANASISYDTATGAIVGSVSVGLGAAAGAGGSFGLAIQTNRVGPAPAVSLNVAASGGYLFFGTSANYNIASFSKFRYLGSDGLSGSLGLFKAFGGGYGFAGVDVTVASFTRRATTPCK